MEILFAKIISLVLIFVAVVLLGGVPIALIKYGGGRSAISDKFRFILSALNSFAGGVFLATCMLELLPEAREAVSEHIASRFGFLQDYPITELTVSAGVVLLLVLEMCIEYCTGAFLERQEELALSDHNELSPRLSDDDKPYQIDSGEELTSDSSPMKTDEDVPLLAKPSVTFNFRLMALVIALSVHSVFDGIAIGVQTDIALLTGVFVAIMMHKSVFAFSLGIRLGESKGNGVTSRDPVYIYLLCFAIATPIGIGIGAVVTIIAGGITGASIVNGILQSLATGTLLYVTFFEILPEELQYKPSVVRVLSLLFGIGIIAFLVGCFSE